MNESLGGDHESDHNKHFIFLNGPTPNSFHLFRSFLTNNTIVTKNDCENISIQYTAPGFEPMTFRTWVVTHNRQMNIFLFD